MKAKLFAIALMAAILYTVLSVSRAQADESTDIIALNNQCIQLKYELLTAVDAMERLEADGVVIPSDAVASVLEGAMLYTEHCQDLTGSLFEEGEG